MSAEEPLFDPVKIIPDYCDLEGANRLKAKIEQYWAERGKVAHVRLVYKGFTHQMRGGRYDLQSNIVDGIPQAISEQSVAA